MSVTLDGDLIRRLIVEVANEVADANAEQPVVIVVGGSLLALRGMRHATRVSTRSDRSRAPVVQRDRSTSSPQGRRSTSTTVRWLSSGPEEVVDAFHAAFPFEEPDKHLAEFIATELGKGGFELPLRSWAGRQQGRPTPATKTARHRIP